MSDSLRDKVVVVTGASSGIGRSIALESAGRGATVILVARSRDKLERIAAEAHEMSGAPTHVFAADMSDSEAIETTFNGIVKVTKHVDYLVNCAGFGKFGSFVEMDRRLVTAMFQVNVLGLM
ncbi:SDR family NAD(P)-dependent oxidoreductase, partial [Lactobacillus sp. XV13L]|nr:SDR family NAD(P)-dependent oxidoreductase [Lactobacillus sp. XV13L]